MSIMYCEKHDEHFDSDFHTECEECGGGGYVTEDADDGEGHIMRGAGDWVRCICNLKKDE